MAADRKIATIDRKSLDINPGNSSVNDLIKANFSLKEIDAIDRLVQKQLSDLNASSFRPLPDFRINWEKVESDNAVGEAVSASTEKTLKVNKPWYQKKVFQKAAIAAGFAGSWGCTGSSQFY